MRTEVANGNRGPASEPLRWIGVVAAIVLGLVLGLERGRWHVPGESLALLGAALALKLTARKPIERITWMRLTIVEIAQAPTLSGQYPQPPLGLMLALAALVFLTTPTVPTRAVARGAIYSLPLLLLVTLRLLPIR